MKTVTHVNKESLKQFAKESIEPGQTLNKDAFTALRVLTEVQHHVVEGTPLELVDEWLPWFQSVIRHFKRYLLGTYHGVSGHYIQAYLDEFCYRLNRPFWEERIPNCLLRIYIVHYPVFLQSVVAK